MGFMVGKTTIIASGVIRTLFTSVIALSGKNVLINVYSESTKKRNAHILDQLSILMKQIEQQTITASLHHTTDLGNFRQNTYQRIGKSDDKATRINLRY
jgi:hypothetical protein